MTGLEHPSYGTGPAALSVLVVNYNAGNLLGECVAAVLAAGARVEVLVGDNGSTDDSLAALRARIGADPRVSIFENGANLGFAAGHNRLLGHTSAPYLLFLNPDCLVAPGTLVRMLDFMETTPDAGLAGCVVRNPDGSEQTASRRAIPDPWIGLVRVLRLDRRWPGLVRGRRLDLTDAPLPAEPLRVDAVSGSFMLVRRTALETVGPLDPGYFLHCEDLDWFVRFARAGWAIYFVPDAEVVHYKGACSTGRPLRVEWHKHRGMVRFFRKFQRARYSAPFAWLVIGGIWGHFGVVALAAGLRRGLGGLRALARGLGAAER